MTVPLSGSPGEIATWRDSLAASEHCFNPLRGSSHILVIAMHTCHYSQNTQQLLLDLPRNLGPLRVCAGFMCSIRVFLMSVTVIF